MKFWVARFLLSMSLAVATGCGTATPTSTPILTPTRVVPSPTPTPSLDEVKEKLGYTLAPSYLPEGFQLSNVFLSNLLLPTGPMTRAQIVFGARGHWLAISYPISFPTEGYLIEGDPNSPRRPENAASRVNVNREPAYLVRGQWSTGTIMQGPGIDPSLAQWDYEASLRLFFDFQVTEEERVGVVIYAFFNPADWITEEEMVRIAESLRRSD